MAATNNAEPAAAHARAAIRALNLLEYEPELTTEEEERRYARASRANAAILTKLKASRLYEGKRKRGGGLDEYEWTPVQCVPIDTKNKQKPSNLPPFQQIKRGVVGTGLTEAGRRTLTGSLCPSRRSPTAIVQQPLPRTGIYN